MARYLANGDLIRCLLKLQNLLVDKLTFFVDDKVRVQGTFIFIGLFPPFADTWEGKRRETALNDDVIWSSAGPAFDMYESCLG
jgi:hypothetical protein